ncbi:hypothetical protein MTR_0149s0060 [Medicago truncatula]|uniref:Uncharacterized protein n=1 Tax=Medicago truncatula TaxID=3880 RepID=A0A072TGR4_MEDTR|nr:hypothetical protein MTR_0149s0060 [Medicago truncatula]
MWYQSRHQALNIKSINTLTGHPALNIRTKAHRASSPQRKSKSSQSIKSSTSNEYARTQQLTTWTTSTIYMTPILWNNILQLDNFDQHMQLNDLIINNSRNNNINILQHSNINNNNLNDINNNNFYIIHFQHII